MNRDMDLEMAMRESHEEGIDVGIEGIENGITGTGNGAAEDDSNDLPDAGEDS
jgi:hypothetical protein